MGFSEYRRQAGDPGSTFDPDDDVTYQVRVTDGGAFEGNDGKEWAKVELEVIDGEHAGRRFDDFRGLNSKMQTEIARDNFVMYGVRWDDVEGLEDLDTALLELVGTTATVSVSHWAEGRFNVKVISARTGQSDIPTDNGFRARESGAARTFEDDVPAAAATDDDDDLPY